MTVLPICMDCKHLREDVREDTLTCDAFPRGIPDEILLMDHDHHQPYAGDHGILFEAKSEGNGGKS